jgi:PST family polysaccharide transporter
VLIKKPEHYLRVPIIYGIGAVISGGLSLAVMFKYEKLRFVFPSSKIIYKHFVNSINFFISDVSVSFFTNSNRLIIGAFLGFSELAYYDLADRIINIFRTIPLNIVKNTIYARVALTKNISLVKRTTLLMSIYAIIAILFINICASQIVLLLGGKEMLPSVIIVRILSLLIFTTHLSNYYITIGLWSLGYDKIFRNIMIISSIVYFVIYLVFYFYNIINLYTITITPIIVDIYVILHIYYVFKPINLKSYASKY